MLQPVAVPLQISLLVLTAVAGWLDLRTRRVPNWLTLAGCSVGLFLGAILNGFAGLQTAALGLGLGLVLYLPLWLLGARGAGDVKLMAAAGSMVGPVNTIALFILAALIGGVCALGLVLYRGASRQTFANIRSILDSLLQLRRPAHSLASAGALRMPHAGVIFLGAAAELSFLR